MARLEIAGLTDDHVEDAARLLAVRHARHREAEPLLPEIADFAAEVEALRAKEGASGAVVYRNGEPIAYVLGTRLSDEVWGPNVWVELAGHAAEDAEAIRDLYALCASEWVDAGRVAHYVYVPAGDGALVDAWFRLGFGAQHAFGIRELGEAETPDTPGVAVREADERDIEALVALAPELNTHQALSPVFSRHRAYTYEELRDDILEDLGNEDVGNLVAEIDGRVVGNLVVVPVEMSPSHTGLARPASTALLTFVVTLPETRGSGAGIALTASCFDWARRRGYDTIVADWRVTNLLSSRFWPQRGFRTTFLRLHRYVA